MLSKEADTILKNLSKVEAGIAKIYSYLSEKEAFTGEARQFWAGLAKEELVHARVFSDIREWAASAAACRVEIEFDPQMLELFVERVNRLLRDVVRQQATEKEAYLFCLFIENELDEAHFARKIQVNDDTLSRKLEKVEKDTKRHGRIIAERAQGVS